MRIRTTLCLLRCFYYGSIVRTVRHDFGTQYTLSTVESSTARTLLFAYRRKTALSTVVSTLFELVKDTNSEGCSNGHHLISLSPCRGHTAGFGIHIHPYSRQPGLPNNKINNHHCSQLLTTDCTSTTLELL